MDALAAYFQIKVRKEDRHKMTFMLHSVRYFFRKTVSVSPIMKTEPKKN